MPMTVKTYEYPAACPGCGKPTERQKVRLHLRCAKPTASGRHWLICPDCRSRINIRVTVIGGAQ